VQACLFKTSHAVGRRDRILSSGLRLQVQCVKTNI
jgi:hypothetical protein